MSTTAASDPTHTPTTSASADREITIRRIHFGIERDDLRHFFANGDPARSHLVASLSALFPPGEEFFVRAVRNYRKQIDDPVLKKQVAGFIGQEAMHGREHRDLNETLTALGYPTSRLERATDRLLKLADRTTPKIGRLATTAALEHYTATFAEALMSDPELRDQLDEPVLNLLLWHALEESEHKAVAFDVFRAVGGTEARRRFSMRMTTAWFVGVTGLYTLISMASDPECRRRPKESLRSLRRLPQAPLFKKSVRRRLADYLRDGFHPDDHESDHLLEEWRTTLFGDDGTLADKLAS